ncbi:MAG: hypothetical protein ACRDKV_09805, partial [Solirubrobacterales bacterium]
IEPLGDPVSLRGVEIGLRRGHLSDPGAEQARGDFRVVLKRPRGGAIREQGDEDLRLELGIGLRRRRLRDAT